MKKNISIALAALLAVIIAVCGAVTVYADTVYYYFGFQYSIVNNSSVTVKGWDNSAASVTIPEKMNDRYVVSVDNYAFSKNTYITDISFDEATQLNRIGIFAFDGCTSLKAVSIPDHVTNIGMGAFQNCSSLETLYYNASTASVPEQCFYNCSSLSTVVMNDRIQSIGKFAFAKTALKEITIPDSVTSIDPTAFDGCEDLVIYCNSGSYAHEFAEENQITHVLLDTDNGYYLGDVDNNRAVEILDITFIQRSLANMTIPDDYIIEHGDIDGDNQITSTDNAIMMRSLAGLITDFPVGEWVVQHEIHQY